MMETKELIKPEKKKEIDSILAECKLPHIPITYYGHDGFLCRPIMSAMHSLTAQSR